MNFPDVGKNLQKAPGFRRDGRVDVVSNDVQIFDSDREKLPGSDEVVGVDVVSNDVQSPDSDRLSRQECFSSD